MPDRSPDSLSPAEELFADWLTRREVEGGAGDLEALCRDHPKEAAEVRRLWVYWEGLRGVLERAGVNPDPRSLGEKIRDKFGSGVDPNVSLDAGGEAVPPSDALLKRLAEHALKGPRYQLRGEIARGGMGAILKVWDEDLRRTLAMKVILGKGVTPSGETPPVDRRLLARFLEEAQVTGQLDHPGIVPVHELGLDSEGRVYFTMKLVKGRDLKQIFDLVFEDKEGWNETRALGVILKVCEAMAYAHAKGVIHRDLKPANIMVGHFGEVYVMDWGLARVEGREDRHDVRLQVEGTPLTSLKTERREEREEAPDSPLFTMDGDVVGTPAYMSPEQARGEIESLGPRSDVYSIGAMLYHLLARHMPYVPSCMRITNRTVLSRLLDGPPTPLHLLRKDMPAELEAICGKAMERELEHRYADTLELAEDLRSFLEGRVVRAYRSGALVELQKWVQRNMALAGSIAAGFLVLAAGLSVSLVLKAQSDRNAKLAAEQATLAEERLKEAEASKTLADKSAMDARWQAYVASTRTADAASRLNEPRNLRRALDGAPKEQRGWEWYHLDAASDSSLLVLKHESRHPVETAFFSPDGSRIVTASYDKTARIWDARTGVELAVLSGHEGPVRAASFSPNGTHIVTASWDKTARVWDSETGVELTVLRGHEGPVRGVSFSPDGSRIVTASEDGTTHVWDAGTGAELLVLRVQGFSVVKAFFSSDGSCIVTILSDPQSNFAPPARIWSAQTGGELDSLHEQGEGVDAASFSPDGSHFVTAFWNGRTATTRVWDFITGAELSVLRSPDPVDEVRFSPDGTRVLTRSVSDKSASIWDARTGANLAVLRGHTGQVGAASFSPDGTRVVTASEDKTARIWDAHTGKELTVLRGHEEAVRAVSFNLDGSRVVTASEDGTARIWDAFTPMEPLALSGPERHVVATCISPDGSRIVTASDDGGTARIWDALTGFQLLVLRGHGESSVKAATFSPDGARIVTASADSTARVWDAVTGVQLLLLRGHEDDVEAATFSLNGARIVTASSDGTARVWDANTGVQLLLLQEDDVEAAAFSPDGARIVTASADGLARIWDAQTGVELNVLRGSEGWLRTASFSPDGLHVLGAFSTAATVWDALTGVELLVLRGHEQQVETASFSPDGSRIITASIDKTARVWDSATGDELAVLREQEWVTAASFGAERIVTGDTQIWNSSGEIIRVWDSVPYRVRFAQRQERADKAAQARKVIDDLEASCADLIEASRGIRTDPDIDPIVRQMASNLLTMRANEASTWLYELQKNTLLPEDIVAQLEADSTRHPWIKKHALLLARSLPMNASRLNEAAWKIVRLPDRSPEEYAKAVRAAQAAAETRPDDANIANTLGIAQYRSGLYKEALSTMARSIELSRKSPDDKPKPYDLAFVAMTQFQLGDKKSAAASLQQLRELMRDQENAKDEDNQSFLKEAQALIEQNDPAAGK